MQESKREIIEKRIARTMENLKKNNMDAYYCKTSREVCELVESLLPKGCTVSSGGSVTLKETGVLDRIQNGEYRYLDRSRPGMTREEVEQVYRETYTCDAYLCSANAITESGLLYNVDGNSNRVSAILYGPKSVIMVVGYNKIVRTLEEAVARVKTTAAPANTMKLSMDTPCSKTGECASFRMQNPSMCDGCQTDARICCNFVVSARQRHKGRIKIILVGECLGF